MVLLDLWILSPLKSSLMRHEILKLFWQLLMCPLYRLSYIFSAFP
ncbi:hypothetical protein ISN44_As03g032410 [Arabidopsis suecica]|uniref:Uncharacterized protein n=1 Tax=Arabidopsis suecica TaxID=45249 RepID=A0A8T2FNX4_ARASU|nr:hypothetical protein ISN44_As03g032410 [Arabidopsis suecica]